MEATQLCSEIGWARKFKKTKDNERIEVDYIDNMERKGRAMTAKLAGHGAMIKKINVVSASFDDRCSQLGDGKIAYKFALMGSPSHYMYTRYIYIYNTKSKPQAHQTTHA